MRSEFRILFNIKTRLLSWENVLNCFIKLTDELNDFFIFDDKIKLSTVLQNKGWPSVLAYLLDVFGKQKQVELKYARSKHNTLMSADILRMFDDKVKARSEVLRVVLLRCKSSGTAELWRYSYYSPSECVKLLSHLCSITSQKTWIFDKIELWIREVMEGNVEIFLNIRKGTVLKFFYENKIEHYFLDLTVKCCDWIGYPFLTCDDYTGP